MNQQINILKIFYWTTLISLTLVAVIVEEFFYSDSPVGILVGRQQLEFVYQTLVVLITLSCCYGSLRLFRLKRIVKELHEHPLTSYQKWSVIRIAMLEVPYFLCIMGYMLFVNPSFVYLGLILLLTFPFIYPTKGRFVNETGYIGE